MRMRRKTLLAVGALVVPGLPLLGCYAALTGDIGVILLLMPVFAITLLVAWLDVLDWGKEIIRRSDAGSEGVCTVRPECGLDRKDVQKQVVRGGSKGEL